MSQTYNLGKVAITPRGAYSSTAQYTPLDILSHNGSSYLVLQNCMGVTPPNATYYMVVASKGDTGSSGASPTIAAGTVTMTPAGTSASVTNVGTNVNASFNFTLPNGNVIYTGTGVTGTSTTPTVFSGSGVSNAGVGDIYFNTSTVAFYRCALGGNASTAKWAFLTYAVPNGSVTADKIADSAVTRNKIADGAVGVDEIADGSVPSSKLGSDVTATLENKANVDGAYEQMTVGNAEQLVSTVGINDNAPYNFRTSGGSVDIGDRETDKIVGGTVAWNQQMREMSSTYYVADGSATISISDGVATVTPSARYGGIRAGNNNLPPNIDGHKMLAVASVLSESMSVFISLNTVVSRTPSTPSQGWQTIYVLINADSSNTNNFRVRVNDTSNFSAFYVKNCVAFDLTQMFGSTIADYVYALESNTEGSGIAWLKSYGFFTKPYYAYDVGGLQSVNTSAHKTVGFNQLKSFLGYSTASTTTFNTNNAVRVISGMEYEFNHGSVSNATSWRHAVVCYDTNGTKLTDSGLITYSGSGGLNYNQSQKYYVNTADGTRTSDIFTPQFDGYVIPFITGGNASASTVVADPCVHLVWDGERDGDYDAYDANEYALDSDLVLRGIPKLGASNNLYYDGDVYESDGTVTRKYDVVDLGTLTWSKYSVTQGTLFRSNEISGATIATGLALPNIICSKYVTVLSGSRAENTISCSVANKVDIIDSTYADSTAEQFKAAMSGINLVYELATQTTESADPYTNPQIVDDWGTEEYVDYAYSQGTRDVQIPVGHDTLYAANLRAKLEMSPNSPDGDGLYAVRQSGGINTYEEIIFPTELPSAPTSDGTYRLVCTVADGVATYSWTSN